MRIRELLEFENVLLNTEQSTASFTSLTLENHSRIMAVDRYSENEMSIMIHDWVVCRQL